jgi:proline iminopeptidase
MRRIAMLLLPLIAVAAFAAENGKTIDTPSGTLYYEAIGGGSSTPLLMINGGPGFDHPYFHFGDDVWNALAKTRTVVFYDQRGTGKSELKAGQTSKLADLLGDIETLRNHLGYERWDVFGHSWGGLLAMAYTARYPDRVRKVVICDSAAPKWSDTEFLFAQVFPDINDRYDSFTFADALGDRAATDAQLREYYRMLFYSPEKRDAFLAKATTDSYRPAINAEVSADLARFDLNPELSKFRMPALVITGRFDMNVSPRTAWKIHRAIPGSELAIFERSGHLPWYEEPARFLSVMEVFLGK